MEEFYSPFWFSIWPMSCQPIKQHVSQKRWKMSFWEKGFRHVWYVSTLLSKVWTAWSLKQSMLAVCESAVSQRYLPFGQTRVGDLSVMARVMKGVLLIKTQNFLAKNNLGCEMLPWIHRLISLWSGLCFMLFSSLALIFAACTKELVKLNLDLNSMNRYFMGYQAEIEIRRKLFHLLISNVRFFHLIAS